MTGAELDAILVRLPEWMRAAVLLARDSGLRIGEVAGVRWFRLDLDRPSVMVADVVLGDGTRRELTKNGGAAEVPMSPRTVEALRALADRTPGRKRTDPVFGNIPRISNPGMPQGVAILGDWARAARREGRREARRGPVRRPVQDQRRVAPRGRPVRPRRDPAVLVRDRGPHGVRDSRGTGVNSSVAAHEPG